MLRHALLMLSSSQEPPPEDEVRFHQARCASHGATHLVATRRLTGLEPGRSRVALYGDASLGNRLLGWGTFGGVRPLRGAAGQAIVAGLPIYAGGRVPDGAAYLVRLTDVQLAPAGAGLEALGGEIEASGAALVAEHLPRSAARALVYYRRRTAGARPGQGAA